MDFTLLLQLAFLFQGSLAQSSQCDAGVTEACAPLDATRIPEATQEEQDDSEVMVVSLLQGVKGSLLKRTAQAEKDVRLHEQHEQVPAPNGAGCGVYVYNHLYTG